MKTKHTPGPWRVLLKDPNATFFSHTVKAKDPTIAFDKTIASFSDEPTDIADAHLISAAPEMLEALQAALIYIQNGAETEYDRQGLEEIVLKVIAKAEGRGE